MRRTQLLFSLAILSLMPRVTHAQPVTQPSFEVATIKPSDPNVKRHMIGVMNTADGIDGQMATLSVLLRVAFGAREFPLDTQLLGLPDWAKSQTYDINAKMSDSDREVFTKLSTPEQQHMTNLMLQSLLAERFNLQLHRGSHQVPAYDLVIGKGGFKLTPTPDDDPSLRKGQDGRPMHGLAMFVRGEIKFQQNTMADLATLLTQQPNGPGRPVVDKTGLTGTYTFTLHWSNAGFNGPPPSPDSEQTSIFTALQEDLGLKLQPSTATFPTLIIDRLDHPTAN